MAKGTRQTGIRVPRSRDDLDRQLASQFRFLVGDCSAYDAGGIDYSRRVALGLRILVHDTRMSKSLLGQLGFLRGMRFLDTRLNEIPGSVIFSAQGLAVDRFVMTAGGPDSTIPPAGTHSFGWAAAGDPHDGRMNMPMRFADWWGDKIIEVTNGDWWSRGRLVLAMVNTDGGGHVDGEMEEAYLELLGETLGMSHSVGGEPVPAPAREWAAANMRQIAHETIRTLQRDWQAAPLLPGDVAYQPPI
jgi:hypothetical protein